MGIKLKATFSVYAFVIVGWMSFCAASISAAVPAVQVHFDLGETELAPLKNDTHFYTNRKYPVRELPAEMSGLVFTRRPISTLTHLSINAPAGSTIYLVADSETGVNGHLPGVKELNASLVKAGWERLPDMHFVGTRGKDGLLSIFKRQFAARELVNFDTVGATGIAVAASNIVLDANNSAPGAMTETSRGQLAVVPPMRHGAEVITPIARPQSTIKSLYVVTEDSGRMLGVATDLIVTATPGESGFTRVSFTAGTGHEMQLVLDDVLRWVHIRYPKWAASKVELSFEDKYSAKDGGSIGAAVGTLFLSILQGFDIDPKAAITGDVSADGKVHRVGGIAAKIRGAEAAGSTIVAIPEDNLPQLADAVVYDGLDSVTRLQIVGVSTLDNAAGVVRVDRDPKLAEAVSVFKQVQDAIHAAPASLHSKAISEKLNIVLADCPTHYSAQLLLMAATNKLPQKLSPSASVYYTVIAMQGLERALYERGGSAERKLSPAAAQEAIKALQRIRPLADAQVLPLIDAERMFVGAVGQEAAGRGNHETTESRRQAVLDALQRMQADRDLVEKMLHGGV